MHSLSVKLVEDVCHQNEGVNQEHEGHAVQKTGSTNAHSRQREPLGLTREKILRCPKFNYSRLESERKRQGKVKWPPELKNKRLLMFLNMCKTLNQLLEAISVII